MKTYIQYKQYVHKQCYIQYKQYVHCDTENHIVITMSLKPALMSMLKFLLFLDQFYANAPFLYRLKTRDNPLKTFGFPRFPRGYRNGTLASNGWANAIKSLSTNPTNWSNTLTQLVGCKLTNCLNVFDHFVGLVLKGLTRLQILNFLGLSHVLFSAFCSPVRDVFTTLSNIYGEPPS